MRTHYRFLHFKNVRVRRTETLSKRRVRFGLDTGWFSVLLFGRDVRETREALISFEIVIELLFVVDVVVVIVVITRVLPMFLLLKSLSFTRVSGSLCTKSTCLFFPDARTWFWPFRFWSHSRRPRSRHR